MRARLTAYSSEPSTDEVPSWRFHIEVLDSGKPLFAETISLEAVILIASARKNGPLYRLCRSIRDATDGYYEALIGVDFGHIDFANTVSIYPIGCPVSASGIMVAISLL
jgi:hypothetical protein